MAVYSKCVIFPKGKTTWEGFQKPFEDGDIVATEHGLFIGIAKVKNNGSYETYCAINGVGSLSINTSCCFERFATEEEKEKLFKAIKDNGYKWDEETKTLEKLIQPKFKVGDRIVHKKNRKTPFVITEITEQSYKGGTRFEVLIEQQDNFELVPAKFDIDTLKPFESRVLVRNVDGDLWKPAIYGFSTSKGCYVVGGVHWRQRIPYEGNEHLLGKTDDCDEYYKTWE